LEVTLGKYAGFCFGLNLAMETIEKNKHIKLSTFGPIMHNDEVINKLEKRGVNVIENFDNVTDSLVLIRSHGVPPSIYEEMERKNIKHIDCTCPFVSKIQKIAFKNKNNGIIIVGNKHHPEIISINGFADNNAIIIETLDEIKDIVFDMDTTYQIMVQTTFIREKFEKIVEKLEEIGLNIKKHDTICSATTDRQEEAKEMSKIMDYMIVIGGKKSSNTHKLYEICKKYCKKTFLIQTIKDLQLNIFCTSDRIGIIAGASTPPDIIKEVFLTMNELDNEDNKTFEEMLNESLITLHTGDVVTGTVINVINGEVSVNLGYKSDGIITREEFSDDPSIIVGDILKSGDEIKVFVIRVNDGDGNVLLSKKKVDSQLKIDELEAFFLDKTPIKGRIVDTVKGGLIALINEVRVFVPSSQISNRFVEDVTVFRNKEFNFNIIEFDKSKRRIVAGRKALVTLEQNEIKGKVISSLNVGDEVTGKVSRIVEFGAFVDIGGVDGLIHISELSWARVKNVKDILNEGDEVKVTILVLDKEKGKISLSLKDAKGNPWDDIEEKLPIGEIFEGKVVRIVKFGVFVELFTGIDGLIHISQISSKHVTKPEKELSVGQVVNVKVLEIDKKNKRISLSKKEAEEISQDKESDSVQQ
jgi:small subunit ribosomal protein S1